MLAPHALAIRSVGLTSSVLLTLGLRVVHAAVETPRATTTGIGGVVSTNFIAAVAGVVASVLIVGMCASSGRKKIDKQHREGAREDPAARLEAGQRLPPQRVPERGGRRQNDGHNYDIHNSPAERVKKPNSRVERPDRSRLPLHNGNPPIRTVVSTGQTDPYSGGSGGSSNYTPSQNSSTSSSATGRNSIDSSARSKEVLALVLTDLQNDSAVGRRRISYTALYFTRVLSKGAFGEVWLAQLENRQVAVKRILNEKRNDEKEIVCFGAEIKLMASFFHPKIVEFVGVSWSSSNDICAVTEYMAKGDLFGFLKRRNGQINWADHKIYLAEDVADALVYLHSLTPKVIHRDLKSKNILLDDNFRAKLSDFGISRERSLEETMTAGVGTIYWTAPEVLMGKKYTEKADIYSFGIVLSELDTHEVPYHDVRDDGGRKLQAMKIVQKVIRENIRPTFTNSIPEIVMDLARRCLNANPDVRPDAVELLQIIQHIQTQL
ncbi:Tkl protein kinase, partial [Globisporangium splendens]